MVQNDVYPFFSCEFLHYIGKVWSFGVVNHQISPELFDALDFFRAGSYNQFCVRSQRISQLKRCSINSAPTAVEDRSLPILEFAKHEHIQERSDIAFAHARSFGKTHTFRNWHYVDSICHGVLSVASTANQGYYSISGIRATNIRTNLLYNSGDFETKDLRITRREWVVSSALHQIRAVDTCCGYLYQDFVGFGGGFVNLAHREHFRTAESIH